MPWRAVMLPIHFGAFGSALPLMKKRPAPFDELVTVPPPPQPETTRSGSLIFVLL